MSRLVVFLAVVMILARMPTARAAESAPVVAVFEIVDRGSGLSHQDRISLTDYLAGKLGEGGVFQIIPREEIRKRLVEQKAESYRDCVDESCQVELGRELAAQFTVNTTIGKVGGQCLLSAALYDLRKAATTRTATARGACNADDLVNHLEQMAMVLKGQAPPESVKESQPPPANPAPPPTVLQQPEPRTKSPWIALAWSILPGGGLYYTGYWFWGTVLGAFEITGIALLAYSSTIDWKEAPTDAGAGCLVGGFVLTVVFGMITAATWEDPDYVRPSGPASATAFRPALDTEPAAAAHPAFVFPVFSTRF